MDHPEEEEYNENLPSSAHLHRGASPGRLPLRAQPQPVSNPIPGGAEGTEALSAQNKPSKQYKKKWVPKKCTSEGCTSNSRGKEGLCARHGAAQKKCTSEGCTSNSRGKEGLCKRHGAAKKAQKKCTSEGCTSNSRGKEGLCVRHGAYLTGPDDIEDKKLKHIVANAILGDVGEPFSIDDEVSYLHFFILIIF